MGLGQCLRLFPDPCASAQHPDDVIRLTSSAAVVLTGDSLCSFGMPFDRLWQRWAKKRDRDGSTFTPEYMLGCSTMIQFALYFITGFCVVWLNLFMWGFSNGPASAIPYFSVVGSLLLFVVATPLSLFLSRIAALVALIGTALILPQPVFILLREASLTGSVLFGVLPTVAVIVAVHHLWKTRSEKLLVAHSSPPLVLRVPLALLPVAILVLAFNARLVVALLLDGPPR